MADIVDKATRSRMMSGIRSRNTRPEILVRKFLHKAGLRFRLHGKLPGRPDVVLRKHNAVVFVHGCYWHRHAGCKLATTPKSRVAFWQNKFKANMQRDRQSRRRLQTLGWRVFVVWSCELDEDHLKKLVKDITEES